ncbi:response regulator transcription factor [Clostridium manihotivorum]|uniref:Stage 0 sporulation protein A homolog n=1 Tax=Clostridium manihotivorum TaxID=2320868 RepID=A0A410DXG7_9CLOT|nr:response regulator transcription factor [Clostridium manihotivorum]QAA33787.1 DNA-binding response regulator [Clostridium manihotivorum]
MYKVMIIEDDAKLCSIIKEHMEKYGYIIYQAMNFNNIEEEIANIKPDILILDINLPYYDGFYICRSVRRNYSIPIIITSARSETMDQVLAIELGADDYIVKPMNLDVFMVKVKAALRRAYGEYSSKLSIDYTGSLCLDEDNFQLKYNKKATVLSKNEYKLAKIFIENKDRIITREEIFEALWDTQDFVDENTLTVNITRLRNRLSELDINDAIKTKRGVGYIFDYKVLEESKYE